MKTIPTSFIEASHRSLATSSAALLLAFAFALSQVHAQVGNTATGSGALYSNTSGDYNTADGLNALYHNTTGSYNMAAGAYALFSNTSGGGNTADGQRALYSNISGADNTADGRYALYYNTTGIRNTANGVQALWNNTAGSYNSANGAFALDHNTTGGWNTATGYSALYSNTIGIDNTANGGYALYKNTTGFNNTADGLNALYYNTTGSNNIALGFAAGVNLTTGSNNINIGHYGVAGEGNTIRIGTAGTQQATFIAGISGSTVPGGVNVLVDADGHLGTVVSSQRFKAQIKPMDKASEAILALQPVTFRYKEEFDPEGIPQFGLVAEQVEKVNPDLVARDGQGKPYTVRYEAVNAMLLNEFLKEHRKVDQQEASIRQLKSTVSRQEVTIAQQQKGMEAVTTRLNEQAAQLQKISARIELSRPKPRKVVGKIP